MAVNNSVNSDRNFSRLAQRALSYWNAEMSTYTNYSFRFELVSADANPDVLLTMDRQIERCGLHRQSDIVGCSPYLEKGHEAPETVKVRIEAGRAEAATTGTMKHELGHVLGINHSEQPRTLMAHESDESLTNAKDRANPWPSDTLSVYVATDQFTDSETTVNQVDHAVAFYDESADGTIPSDIHFHRTDDRTAADIVILKDTEGCHRSDQSYGALNGKSIDQDGDFEQYTGMEICLADIDEEARGWHTGYWLSHAMGLDESERADVFVDADYDDRRSDWWT